MTSIHFSTLLVPELDALLEKQLNTGGAAVVKSPAVMRRGQVSFHNCRTIHGSAPNQTDRPRRSIDGHPDYADPTFCPRVGVLSQARRLQESS